MTTTRRETERGKKGRSSRPVALGKVNLLLALLALLVLAGAYRLSFLPEALALVVLTVSLVTVVSRPWHARRGGLEYGLLRHPFRRELRPYLLQCLNHWLFWALFGAAILGHVCDGPGPRHARPIVALAGPDPLPTARDLALRWSNRDGCACAHASPPSAGRDQRPGGYRQRLPRHPTGAHLTPPVDPVAIHAPLAGEWAMLAGGRSVLISHHYPTPIVSNAVDFVRLDEEGRSHDGDPKRRRLGTASASPFCPRPMARSSA